MKTPGKYPSPFHILAILMVMANILAFAQQENPDNKTLSPYFLVRSDEATTEQLPLYSTRADVTIAGIIAGVSVTQVYQNKGSKPIEAIYVFPASTRAAVNRLRMTIGERTIEAVIRDKQQARQDYENARQQGQTASLLEQQRPNIFQMNVANIMPGDKLIVNLEYSELLIPEKGLYEFVFPTIVGPRYGNQALASAKTEDPWVNNPYTHQGQLPSYTFELNCMLNAGVPVSDLRVTSHEADIQYLNQEKALIKLTDNSKGNKDVILQYRLCGKTIESGLLLYEGKDENFFLAMIQPPVKIQPSAVPAREYVFIVDVSGSMHGFPLDISKTLFRDLIGKLKSSDFFNIILFAGGSQVFSGSPVSASPDNISKGIAFIDKQQGGGGTELLPALKRALALGSGEGIARTFIIATDGYVTVEKEAFSLIRSSLNKANFFAFGIGSSVNRYLIEGIAHAGMGETFIITKQAEAATTAARFREYIESPVLTDLTVSFRGISAYDIEPSGIPDVFAERPVIIFGKWKGNKTGAGITLSGRNGNGNYRQTLAFSDAGNNSENSVIRYLWARERIRNLDDFGAAGNDHDDASVKKQVTALGLKYNLLTQYTSFIAIDTDIRNKTGRSSTVTQPLPLPEGVSDYATGSFASSSPPMGSVGKEKALYAKTEESKASAEPELTDTSRKSPVISRVEELPEFPGGIEALRKYLTTLLVYPEEAKAHGISGIVYVRFTVNTDGTVSEVKVIKGIGGGCDEEAIRLVKAMPKWRAAKNAGKAVKTEFTLPIQFIQGS